jgi:ADP-heptose:LPS heptosyltransferase
MRLRRRAPAAFISTANESPEARWLANMLRPALWTGMGDRPPPRVHRSIEVRFTPYDKDAPEALAKLSLLRPLGIDPGPSAGGLFYPLSADARADASDFLSAEGIDSARPLVLLSHGSGWPGKNWPLDRYLDLARRLTAGNRAQVAWLGTPAEAAALPPGARPLPGLDWMGRLPLPLLAAVMARATAWVGNDTGPMHLAAAVGCPTLSLWGPTEPAKWAPRGPPHRHIRLHPRCSGCTYWDPASRCLRPTHECMEAIATDLVMSALSPLL